MNKKEECVHPDFDTEIPWIETESYYEEVVGPKPLDQNNVPVIAQRVTEAC